MKTGFETLLITLLACAIVLQVNGWKFKPYLQKYSMGKRKERLTGNGNDNGNGTQHVSLSIQGWEDYGIPQNLTVPLLKKIMEFVTEFKKGHYCPYKAPKNCTGLSNIKSIMTEIVANVIKNSTLAAQDDDDYDDAMASSSGIKLSHIQSIGLAPTIKVDGEEVAPEDVDKKIHEKYPNKVPKISVDDEDLDPADIAMAEEFAKNPKRMLRKNYKYKTNRHRYSFSDEDSFESELYQTEELADGDVHSDLAHTDPNKMLLFVLKAEDKRKKMFRKIVDGNNIFLKNLLKKDRKYAHHYMQESPKSNLVILRKDGRSRVKHRLHHPIAYLLGQYSNFHIGPQYKTQKYIKYMGPFKGFKR